MGNFPVFDNNYNVLCLKNTPKSGVFFQKWIARP